MKATRGTVARGSRQKAVVFLLMGIQYPLGLNHRLRLLVEGLHHHAALVLRRCELLGLRYLRCGDGRFASTSKSLTLNLGGKQGRPRTHGLLITTEEGVQLRGVAGCQLFIAGNSQGPIPGGRVLALLAPRSAGARVCQLREARRLRGPRLLPCHRGGSVVIVSVGLLPFP